MQKTFPIRIKLVMSLREPMKKSTEHVQFVHGDIVSFTNQLKQQEEKVCGLLAAGSFSLHL